MSTPATDPFGALRAATRARVALGRVGDALPTAELLALRAAQAAARDAVHAPLDTADLERQLGELGRAVRVVASAAPDRPAYLQRPDLGRRLADDSQLAPAEDGSRPTAGADRTDPDRAAGGDDPAAGGHDPAGGGDDPAAAAGTPAGGGDDPAAAAGTPAAGSDDPAAAAGTPAAGGHDPAGGGGPAAGGYDLVVVLADGLSPLAVQSHAVPLLAALLERLDERTGPRLAPIVIATQARVAIGDEIAAAIGAHSVLVLIGERPGMSSTDSLGAYFTYGARPGRRDSERNCVSNIRPPHGTGYDAAATTLVLLMAEANRLKLSGIGLKADPALPG